MFTDQEDKLIYVRKKLQMILLCVEQGWEVRHSVNMKNRREEKNMFYYFYTLLYCFLLLQF